MTLQKQLLLHYFSGTGNSRRAALWMREAALEAGWASETFSIESTDTDDMGEATGAPDMIGLLTPTHGFITPWKMIKFAFSLKPGQGADAFCVTTRGGWKLGRVFTPGIGGMSAFFLALLLFLKGYRVRGVLGLDMPSNWTACPIRRFLLRKAKRLSTTPGKKPTGLFSEYFKGDRDGWQLTLFGIF